MRKLLLAWVLCAHFQHARAQYDFLPITKLLTDSAGVIGQSGQNLGFMIVRGDSVLFEKYWGSWNNTTYQAIASGSKMPSMALLMKLVNDGRLSLSDTVQRFIPAFRNKPVITLGQLMSHTSGLPGISPYISNNGFTLKQAADSIGLRTPMTSFAPGSAFQYGGV
ncbi:MAG: serine hydrolase domain-containing protein, partial [Bacteroidota bacterium]